MKDLKNILLLGAGAVGVLIAEKLCRMPGINFAAAADPGRITRYRRDGIFFNGEKLPLSFISPGDDFPAADLVIVTTKTTALPEALEICHDFTDKNTIFLPFLNGITAKEVISSRFPGNCVLEGFFIGHASVRCGNFITHDGCGTFCCGGEKTALEMVEKLFAQAKINIEFPPDMQHAIWKKFILNVGINQVQAAFGANYGEVQKSPELMVFCKELMLEAINVAQAENVADTGKMLAPAIEIISSMPPDVKTSMLQDIQAERKTEIEAFAGTVCAKAEIYGIPVPRNREVYNIIRKKETEYRCI